MNIKLDDLMRLTQAPPGTAPIGVWVPCETMSMHMVDRPQAPPNRWPEIASWLLADELPGAPGQYRFGIATPSEQDEKVEIAVVRTSIVEDWTRQIKALGSRFAGLLPDFMLLPYESGRWTVWCEQQRCVVRIGRCEGFACSTEWINTLREGGHQALANARFLVSSDDVPLQVADAEYWLPNWSVIPEQFIRFEEMNAPGHSRSSIENAVLILALAAAMVFPSLALWAETRQLDRSARLIEQRLVAGGSVNSVDVESPTLGQLQQIDSFIRDCIGCRPEQIVLTGSAVELQIAAPEAAIAQAAASGGWSWRPINDNRYLIQRVWGTR